MPEVFLPLEYPIARAFCNHTILTQMNTFQWRTSRFAEQLSAGPENGSGRAPEQEDAAGEPASLGPLGLELHLGVKTGPDQARGSEHLLVPPVGFDSGTVKCQSARLCHLPATLVTSVRARAIIPASSTDPVSRTAASSLTIIKLRGLELAGTTVDRPGPGPWPSYRGDRTSGQATLHRPPTVLASLDGKRRECSPLR